jgi:hypothetical protein
MNDPSFPPIRRVVTGHNDDNVAKVIFDGAATNARRPPSGNVSTLIRCTDGTPAVQRGAAPASLMMRSHFTASACTKAANSSAVMLIGSMCTSVSRFAAVGSAVSSRI